MLHRGKVALLYFCLQMLVKPMSKAANAAAVSAVKRAEKKISGAGKISAAAAAANKARCVLDAIPPATTADAPAAADTDAATGDALEAAAKGASSKGSGAWIGSFSTK